jgi:hypothetical protein
VAGNIFFHFISKGQYNGGKLGIVALISLHYSRQQGGMMKEKINK